MPIGVLEPHDAAFTDLFPERISTMTQAASLPPLRAAEPDNAAASRRHNEGHGRRLTAAFEALENFPALAESRDRVLRLVGEDRMNMGDVVAAVEGDVALVIAVLRVANQQDGRQRRNSQRVVVAVFRNCTRTLHAGHDRLVSLRICHVRLLQVCPSAADRCTGLETFLGARGWETGIDRTLLLAGPLPRPSRSSPLSVIMAMD